MASRKGPRPNVLDAFGEKVWRVMYFDGQWEELIHLRLEAAFETEVIAAIATWLHYRQDQKNGVAPALHPLNGVSAMSLEVIRG